MKKILFIYEIINYNNKQIRLSVHFFFNLISYTRTAKHEEAKNRTKD